MTELLQHQAADRLVLAFGGTVAGRGGDLVDPQQTRHHPAAAGGHHVGGGVIVLVPDIAHDLFDHVLDRHQPGGAAVLVNHQRGLHAVGPHLLHHGIAVEGGGHYRDGPGQTGQGGRGALFPWHFEDLLHVHDADRRVQVAFGDGEP